MITSSPIHRHVPDALVALARGSNVLMEKPMCATVQEADALIAARDKAKRFVLVGYQRSFSPAVQELKRDIQSGLYGRPLRVKALCNWARSDHYYGRNNWAGRRQMPSGAWVLDSPANNACAHFVHHMFYILGREKHTSAVPARVQAELYRANDITNFDTCAIRAITTEGIEVLFFATHAVTEKRRTLTREEFERGVVTWDDETGLMVGRTTGGTEKVYERREGPHVPGKLVEALELCRGVGSVSCGPEAARSQTLCINAAAESAPEPVVFDPSMVAVAEDAEGRVTWVPGLDETLVKCYEAAKLPSEMGVVWARAGAEIDLAGYKWFPGGKRPAE
jgi:predicted dehydrogenase